MQRDPGVASRAPAAALDEPDLGPTDLTPGPHDRAPDDRATAADNRPPADRIPASNGSANTPGDLAVEQAHLDAAYGALAAMAERTAAAAADARARAKGNWDAGVALAHLEDRLVSLGDDARPLCFGRIDEEHGPAWHVGRRHVETPDGEALVVDWRAEVAVPFYRATFRDPLGLRRRRRLLVDGRTVSDLLDEDFDDPESAAQAAGGLPDPLLAELGRSRTGGMRDIVATIAAEQDAIIRAPLGEALIVQGGPGTGKTAVGLHRVAFLLYEHRDVLERNGVLVLGPNRLFLTYISEVLPSLGEVAVTQTTLAGLVPQWAEGALAPEPAEVAALEGDARMATVLARAVTLDVAPPVAGRDLPSEGLLVNTRLGPVRVDATTLATLVEGALESGGPVGVRRDRFRRGVAREVATRLSERRGELVDAPGIATDLRRDATAGRVLERIWPAQSPMVLLRRLLASADRLARAADGTLDDDEQALLLDAPRARTASDLALLDEVRFLLEGPPQRYGHVVVDEAQDLSPMELRMVARRCRDRRSLTILGDLAQATAPGAPRSWHVAAMALGLPVDTTTRPIPVRQTPVPPTPAPPTTPGQTRPGPTTARPTTVPPDLDDPAGSPSDSGLSGAGLRLETLDVGYRVPQPLMALANALLAAYAPELPQTRSIRSDGRAPERRNVGRGERPAIAAAEALRLAADHGSVAIVAAVDAAAIDAELRRAGSPPVPPGQPLPGRRVSLVGPAEAKGLEFDAVVVVEPAAFLRQPGGVGLLYVALTRAVQQLVLVHADPLPDPLADPSGSALAEPLPDGSTPAARSEAAPEQRDVLDDRSG